MRVTLQGWSATVQATTKRLGYDVDSVQDLSRVMRLPGTVNHKGPDKPVRSRSLTELSIGASPPILREVVPRGLRHRGDHQWQYQGVSGTRRLRIALYGPRSARGHRGRPGDAARESSRHRAGEWPASCQRAPEYPKERTAQSALHAQGGDVTRRSLLPWVQHDMNAPTTGRYSMRGVWEAGAGSPSQGLVVHLTGLSGIGLSGTRRFRGGTLASPNAP